MVSRPWFWLHLLTIPPRNKNISSVILFTLILFIFHFNVVQLYSHFDSDGDIFLMIFPLTEHAQQIAGWLPFISSDKGNNTRDNPKFITSSMFSLAIHSIPDDQHSPSPDNFVIYLFLFLIWFWFLLLLLILF